MAREARIVLPGYLHHVTQRGNYRQNVFEEDQKIKRLGVSALIGGDKAQTPFFGGTPKAPAVRRKKVKPRSRLGAAKGSYWRDGFKLPGSLPARN